MNDVLMTVKDVLRAVNKELGLLAEGRRIQLDQLRVRGPCPYAALEVEGLSEFKAEFDKYIKQVVEPLRRRVEDALWDVEALLVREVKERERS